jgi:lethal(2) giant larvae protein
VILVHATIPTLWSGTNASLVSIFVLHIPQRTGTTPDENPKPIVGQLAKEIQIKHRAPVISIALFDAVRELEFILIRFKI